MEHFQGSQIYPLRNWSVCWNQLSSCVIFVQSLKKSPRSNVSFYHKSFVNTLRKNPIYCNHKVGVVLVVSTPENSPRNNTIIEKGDSFPKLKAHKEGDQKINLLSKYLNAFLCFAILFLFCLLGESPFNKKKTDPISRKLLALATRNGGVRRKKDVILCLFLISPPRQVPKTSQPRLRVASTSVDFGFCLHLLLNILNLTSSTFSTSFPAVGFVSSEKCVCVCSPWAYCVARWLWDGASTPSQFNFGRSGFGWKVSSWFTETHSKQGLKFAQSAGRYWPATLAFSFGLNLGFVSRWLVDFETDFWK